MTKEDWRNYRAACNEAFNCRRTRSWQSNVIVAYCQHAVMKLGSVQRVLFAELKSERE